jgi:hypothetical protein
MARMPPDADDARTAIEKLKAPSAETELLQALCGTFAVKSRLWPAAGAEPMVTTAVARRRMIDGMYLEEVMEPAAAPDPPFNRICYLGFNPLGRRWEYVSLDSRIPVQLMYELSVEPTLGEGSTVTLYLPSFSLPGWGTEVTGESARQRREIALGDPDRQAMRQYWTLPAAPEYLAVEYSYERLEQ